MTAVSAAITLAFLFVDMLCYTVDGSMDSVPQILYGQYLILGVFGSFLLEREPATLFHEQGTHSDKIELIVWPEIPQMSHKISAQFVCPSPKVSNF